MKKGIINIAEFDSVRMCAFCGDNHTSKVIEIIPYNGKGSATAICESCLEELRNVLEQDKENE
jgi:folylpolyglutamate synthase/dihydropteroate synthase